MLKKALFILASLTFCLNICAQKEVISIKEFTKSGNKVSNPDLDAVRAAVSSALSKSERFEIINGEEEAADARYIMEGNVSSCVVTKETIEKKVLYCCKLQYSVKVIDVETSMTILSESYTHPKNQLVAIPMAKTNETDAKSTAIKKIADDIEEFIIKAFPIVGTIFAEDYEVDGKDLEYCYINVGRINGVKVDDQFNIYEVKIKVGREVETKIGRLKVIEVDEDIARCKVTRDKRKVKQAMDRYLQNSIDNPDAKLLRVKLTSN